MLQELEDWQRIHPKITSDLQKKWESKGFSYEKSKEWINIGLNIDDADFANFLRSRYNYLRNDHIHELSPKQILDEEGSIEKLRTKFQYYLNNWKSVHDTYEDFDSEIQRDWEDDCGFNFEETKQWLSEGFYPTEYSEAKSWKNYGFNSDEARSWLRLGLKKDESLFASYLEGKEINLAEIRNNLTKKKEEYLNWKKTSTQQEYMETIYYSRRKEKIIKIDIEEKNFYGFLNIFNFSNLEEINCSRNSFISLELKKCPKIKKVNCFNNKLENLSIIDCPKVQEVRCSNNKRLSRVNFNSNFLIRELHCSKCNISSLNLSKNNELTNLDCSINFLTKLIFPDEKKNLVNLWLLFTKISEDLSVFSQFTNLEGLYLENSSFYGSLKSLKSLIKLKIIDIWKTSIVVDLEHSPENLERIRCDEKLTEQLKGYEIDQGYYNYQAWKKDQLVKFLEEENTKIEFLEDDILRLTNLTNEQRLKIINAYLKFAPEKELLKELINLQLEFTKFKRTNNDTSDYDEKCEEYEEVIQALKKELRKAVSKEEMNEVRNILSDCEILVQWELELENEIIRRRLLLNDAYQKVISLEINIKKIEASDNAHVYIGNIMNSHNQLDKYDNYHSVASLTEMLGNINFNFQSEINNNDNSTNYFGNKMTINNNYHSQQNQIEIPPK